MSQLETIPTYASNTLFDVDTRQVDAAPRDYAELIAYIGQRKLDDYQRAELEQMPIGSKVKMAVAAFQQLYTGRRYGGQFHIGDTIIEDHIVATRYQDEVGIEEVYVLTDYYDSRLKDGHRQTATAAIQGPEVTYQISVNEQDQVTVSSRAHGTQGWQELDKDTTTQVIDDYMRRSLDAARKHVERSDNEREIADASAREYFELQHPELTGYFTSAE